VVCKVTVLQVEIIIADWVMVYRLYHIYGKKLAVCIIPFIGSLGQLIVVLKITVATATGYRGKEMTAWIAACFSFAIFNCLCTSSLIAIRLWRTHARIPEHRIHVSQSLVARALYIVVESAALWSIFVVISFSLILVQTDFEFTFLDVTGPVIGISFCLIVIRLGHAAERGPSLSMPRTVEIIVPMTTTKTEGLLSSGSTRDYPGTATQFSRVGQ